MIAPAHYTLCKTCQRVLQVYQGHVLDCATCSICEYMQVASGTLLRKQRFAQGWSGPSDRATLLIEGRWVESWALWSVE